MRIGDTAITAIGLFFQQIVTFLIGIYVARSLGASEYGTLSIVLNFTSIALTFAPLGLDIALLKYLPKIGNNENQKHRQFMAFRISIFISSFVIFAVLALSASRLQSNFYRFENFSTFLILGALNLPFAADIALFSAYCRAFGQVKRFVVATLLVQTTIRAILTVFVIESGYAAGGAIVASIVATALSSLTFNFVYEKQIRTQSDVQRQITKDDPMFSFNEWNVVINTIKESIWMAFSLFVYSTMRSLDILVLGIYCSTNIVGSYSSISFVAVIIFIVPLALSQTLGPQISRLYTAGDMIGIKLTFDSYIQKASIASGFLTGGIAAFGSRLDLLFGPSFTVSTSLALLLPIGQFASALFGPTGFALSMTGRHRQELYILIAGSALLTALLFFFVPYFGAVGAAIASMIAYLATNIARYILVHRYLGVWLGQWHSCSPPLIALTVAYFIHFLGEYFFGYSIIVVSMSCVFYTFAFLAITHAKWFDLVTPTKHAFGYSAVHSK